MKKTLNWGLLLDLDETLVLTSAIEPLRRRRQWTKIYASFSKTTLPTGTRAFLEEAQKITQLGVVTSGPRPYAERLLAHHNIDIPVLVAYHDVQNRKPHPEPIRKAAKLLGLDCAKCIHIGDAAGDIVATIKAGAAAIGLSWDGTLASEPESENAHAICDNWDDVLSAARELILGGKTS